MIYIDVVYAVVGLIACCHLVQADLAGKDTTQLFQKKCDQLDCPAYVVIKKMENYEIRRYGKTSWAYSEETGTAFGRSKFRAYMKLFKFFKGENGDKKKIPRTRPVLTTVSRSKDKSSSYIRMHYFIPYAFQGQVPAPSSEEVKLVTYEPMDVFACTFRGDLSIKNVESNKRKCFRHFASDGMKFNQDRYTIAAYDGPWKGKDRYNEIMIVRDYNPKITVN